MKKIAIITARGGSKGLPNKNMLMVDGKPLLAYSIEAALNAEIFEKIILTTDSQEYIDFLSHYSIDFIRRADHLATDKASSFEVLEDVLRREEYQDCDYFVLLQPTSPLRTSEHILEACTRFEANYSDFDYLVSVSDAHKPTTLTRQIDEDESLKHFDLDYSRYARQNYAPEYSPNGAFFIGKPEPYLETRQFYGKKSLAYFMSKDVSIDIDDRDDFEYFFTVIQRRKRYNMLKQNASREADLKSSVALEACDLSFLGGSLLALYKRKECSGLKLQNLSVISSTASWYKDLVLSNEHLKLSPKVILSFGRDELRYLDVDIKEVADDILRVVDRVREIVPKSRIYVLECLKALFRVDLKNSQVEELNLLLREHIMDLDSVFWVETNKYFVDKYGKLLQAYTYDGLNLTEEGYAKLESLISESIG